MLAPKRQKFRKQFRGNWRKIATKGNELNFGRYGLISIDSGWVKDRQIEASRLILARATRKNGKYWIRIFPDKSYTQKPEGVTMGAGKGEVVSYVCPVSPGRVLFELDGVERNDAIKIFKNISSKLSVRTTFIEKNL